MTYPEETILLHPMARILAVLALVFMFGCSGAQPIDDGIDRPPPQECQPTTIAEARALLGEAEVIDDRGTLADRCRATQERRLGECETKPEREQQACVAEVLSIQERCDAFAANADGGNLLVECSGTCATRQCTPQNPCNLGGGKICTTGTMCTARGTVCNPGVIFDCVCTQIFRRTASDCDCVCEW